MLRFIAGGDNNNGKEILDNGIVKLAFVKSFRLMLVTIAIGNGGFMFAPRSGFG